MAALASIIGCALLLGSPPSGAAPAAPLGGTAPLRLAPSAPRVEVRPSRMPVPQKPKKKPGASRTPVRPAVEKEAPCDGVNPGELRLPFRPGEELSYDILVAGLYVGRLETKVGRPRNIGGQKAVSLFGRAFSSVVVSGLQKFEGRYMALSDPKTLLPYGVKVESTYGRDPRRETARFAEDQKSIETDYLFMGQQGQYRYTRENEIYDALSVLFLARSMPLRPGQEACQEVYSTRRLWRMEAKVLEPGRMSTPIGDKPVDIIQLKVERMVDPKQHGNLPELLIDGLVYLSKDATRTPMAFELRSRLGNARGELKRWVIEGDAHDPDWATF